MKPEALVRELERLAHAVGFEVRTERGRFRGGRCRLEGHRLVVLNRQHPPETNAALLAAALAGADLSGVFVPPALRTPIEEARGAALGVREDARVTPPPATLPPPHPDPRTPNRP